MSGRGFHLLAAAVVCITSTVSAASPNTLPPPAEPPPPLEDEPLHLGSLSLYTENDLYFGGTDRHYTNGFKLSALTTRLASFTDDPVPPVVQQLARTLGELLPEGPDYKLGLSLGQNLYTPSDIATSEPLPGDRPYAAWLYLGSAFQIYSPPRTSSEGLQSVARLDVIEVTLGVVGPAALGRQVQNNVHNLFGIDTARGWHHQLRNEPGLNLVFERRYRFSTDIVRGHSGWGADIIPHFGASLGNVFTYATAGAEARAGYHLPADFGANLIRPTGDSGALRRPRLNAYVFAAVDGRAIARDVTLDGNTWRDSPSVDKKTFVADVRGGLALGTRHWQLTYTQVLRTREFRGQEKNSVFGSLSLSYHY